MWLWRTRDQIIRCNKSTLFCTYEHFNAIQNHNSYTIQLSCETKISITILRWRFCILAIELSSIGESKFLSWQHDYHFYSTIQLALRQRLNLTVDKFLITVIHIIHEKIVPNKWDNQHRILSQVITFWWKKKTSGSMYHLRFVYDFMSCHIRISIE